MQKVFEEMLDELDNILKGHRYYSMEKMHTMQVVDNGILLSEKEKPDIRIVVPATIFHDVGRYIGLQNHEELDSAFLSKILKRFEYTNKQACSIYDCIRAHSNRSKQKPSTLEQKVVFDADNLTLITPFGVARWFFMAKEWGGVRDIKESVENLDAIYQRIDNNEFYYTNAAREIAKHNKFFRSYIENLRQELNRYKP
jgi:HD superfamily phosphodiesterase